MKDDPMDFDLLGILISGVAWAVLLVFAWTALIVLAAKLGIV